MTHQRSQTHHYIKQKTAYEILRSDWSSDVCSSDLESAMCQLFHKSRSLYYT